MNKTIWACLLSITASTSAADWPQWRGPARDGQVPGTNWPASLQTNALRETWRVELGPSYSGPIVSGDRVITTATKGKKFEVVTAHDRATGKELWRAQWEGALSVPFFAKSNGDWIRATPATDGERVFVAGMRDVLVCLDLASGRELWRLDFAKEFKAPVPSFGYVCSPLLDGEHLFTQAGASVVKLEKRTGKVAWRALKDDGGMWGSAFSSPVIAELAGRRQLVVQTREKLAGLDLETGAMLWEQNVESFRGMNILTPVAHRDTLFTSAYGGKTIGFGIELKDGKFSSSQRWQHKSQGYMSTPVVVNGVAYHHLRSQRATAIDIATGRELWTSGESFGKYWSLVTQGDRILALDERGWLFLLKANPERLEVLDRRKIAKTESWAHLAVAGRQVFIRELGALTAYEWADDRETVR